MGSRQATAILENNAHGQDVIIRAPSRFVTLMASVFAWFLGVIFLGLLLSNLAAGNRWAAASLLMVAVPAVYFAYRWIKQPQEYRLSFGSAALTVQGKVFPYSEISRYGINSQYVPPHDVVNMPLPRNTQFGWHVYIVFREAYLPVTGGMRREEAEDALRVIQDAAAGKIEHSQ